MDTPSESGIILTDAADFNPEFTDFETLNQGRTNIVVKARRQGRWWVLKGLTEATRNDYAHIQLLRKEFEIMSSMQHPGIAMAVSIENVPEYGPCIVMEWVDGVTLKGWLAERRSSAERRRVAFQIMDALEYVHGKQAAHRDLKPSNIMITRNGNHVKLIDFGLSDTDDFAVYKQPAGTKGYLSPEQASTRVTDVRNDIYSLGCVLEDMEIGKPQIICRCKASAGKRYSNISEVRRAFKRVSSLKRSAGLTVIIAAALVCGYLISAIPVHKEREARRIENELKSMHEAEIEAAVAEGRRLMDEVLASVDISALDTWEEASVVQYETALKLSEIWESYPKSLGPAFTATERENVKSILTTHWSDIIKPLTERVNELAAGSQPA